MDVKDKLESHFDLITGNQFAVVTTINPDGTPQSTPMWIDFDSATNEILVNTAKGRTKYNNMKARRDVSICIIDQNNPYRYLSINGKVTWMTEEGAVEHIDSLAQKYMDKEEYPLPAGEIRIKIGIKPEQIITMG